MTDAVMLATKARIPLRDQPLDTDYQALVDVFPLVSMRDDAHLSQAISLIHQLLDKGLLSPGEQAYLGALTDLVETYEDAHVHIRDVTGVELLRYLMEEGGLTQKDLAPLFGAPSIVSEILSGRRPLALSHIRRLSRRFKLPADAFID